MNGENIERPAGGAWPAFAPSASRMSTALGAPIDIVGELLFVVPTGREMEGLWADFDVERAILRLHPDAEPLCRLFEADGFDIGQLFQKAHHDSLSASSIATKLAGSSRGAPNWIGKVASGHSLPSGVACFDAGPAWVMVGDGLWPRLLHKALKPSTASWRACCVEREWPLLDQVAVAEMVGKLAIACCSSQGIDWGESSSLALAGGRWRADVEASEISESSALPKGPSASVRRV